MQTVLEDPERIEEYAGAWEMLTEMLPSVDWSAEASEDRIPEAVDQKITGDVDPILGANIYEQITRVLYRRKNNHVLLTGLKGVGKTTIVRELARRAALGEFLFLKEKRFLWLDCTNIGPEDSRACLETIATAVTGRSDIVLCLDGIDALLKRSQSGTNKPLLRAIASRGGIQIIGILSRWAFNDLIGSDAEMLELFTRIEIEEPQEETVLEIVRQKASEFERDYGLQIDDSVVRRSVILASNFLLNEHHPAKAVKILRQVCENADYEATQLERPIARVTTEGVIRVVAEITGIPRITLSGETSDSDFESVLLSSIVGQQQSVQAAATELRLIKSGLSEPGKPASVMLFAGMTGVGKTELAKRIAELYSTSKRLQVYSMGNFTEPHSVSGIIGVPPGYVGHEQGGRLINELNADPYSVFLLDEAEKCHPNVWKPFLNLFDEGWIADQRGVKAYADRAIFILTTNAGDNAITQMSRSGKSEEEIVERVKQTLSRIRQERSSQPVFTPQFLSRMKRIMVFQPLDQEAMIGIARILVRQVQDLWLQKREKHLVVSESLIEFLGSRSHELNEKSGGKEGGRIVRKLISDLIESKVQDQAISQPDEYKRSREIILEISIPDCEAADEENSQPGIKVCFR